MKIVLYVHDLFLEIGHSRAMIETINKLPQNYIKELKIVSFTADNTDKLFPGLVGKVTIEKVPFKKIKPVLLKAIFYHIYTLIYSLIYINKTWTKISIGIASLTSDIVNVQFVHKQWSQQFFIDKKLNIIQWLYKKVFFTYLNLVESFVYRKENIKLICLSSFIGEFCKEHFNLSDKNVLIAYSSVNTEEFCFNPTNKDEIYNEILKIHPEINGIDINKPIALFVGAYERKGLPTVYKNLNKNSQIIIVGQEERAGVIKEPDNLNIFKIQHSSILSKIYNLADCFIFPTAYEPFGLVIFEAAMMGLDVYVSRFNVGATELLDNLDGVTIYNSPLDFKTIYPELLSTETKIKNIKQRKEKLKDYNWKNVSNVFKFAIDNS